MRGTLSDREEAGRDVHVEKEAGLAEPDVPEEGDLGWFSASGFKESSREKSSSSPASFVVFVGPSHHIWITCDDPVPPNLLNGQEER